MLPKLQYAFFLIFTAALYVVHSPDIFSIKYSSTYWITLHYFFKEFLKEYTPNNNESLKAVIWSMAPKVHYSGAKILEITLYIIANAINNVYTST